MAKPSQKDITEWLLMFCGCALEEGCTHCFASTEITRLRAEVQRLQAELLESDELRDRMTSILYRTADALHGGPLENGLWSWHDLPELAEEARRG